MVGKANGGDYMAVNLVSEEDVPRLRLLPPVDEAPAPVREPIDRSAIAIQAIGTLTALASILSVRFILLLAAVGAFTLAATHVSLWTLGVYCVTVFVPLVALAWRKG